MGFWIFMTVCNFLMPALMVIIGKIWLKHPPKSINSSYGYCTPMSQKNQDTWDFAQAYCGKMDCSSEFEQSIFLLYGKRFLHFPIP